MRRALSIGAALLALLGVLALTADAEAQRRRRRGRDAEPEAPADPLQAAEEAFTAVDFERTLEHASTALQAGGHAPAQLVRIYQLLGLSAAALGDPDGARGFFQRMLAVDPQATLDDTVPPRLRAPFLEARGIVTSRASPLGVEVSLARAQASLRAALTDPFQMVQTVRVHGRLEGGLEWTSVEAEAAGELLAPIAGADTADRVEYWVEALDAYGNRVLLVGTEFEPRVVGRTEAAAGGGGTAAPVDGGRSIAEEPWLWIVVGSVVLVGAAIGIGVAVETASHVPAQVGVTIGAIALP